MAGWAERFKARLEAATPAGVVWHLKALGGGGVVISRHSQGVVQDTILDATFFQSPEYRQFARIGRTVAELFAEDGRVERGN
ncbi:hypothetical protein, partial [Klebsiella pneumoniae]|uniref:hypothetical protein n=1 Tax=Klebsiella pneumoniae TaxID=573 RepID=UPI00351E94A8